MISLLLLTASVLAAHLTSLIHATEIRRLRREVNRVNALLLEQPVDPNSGRFLVNVSGDLDLYRLADHVGPRD